jgi:lipopolysaccharide/colanic/teichoic acid biosynthesis glycosyltransferase
MVRHFIKPGITGWAQINGLRGETKTVGDMHERIKADVWYMENWSFVLDLKIIFLTAFNIMQGDKNAF